MTHEELHSFIFMKEEKDVDVLDLAGLENAPGVYHEVTQSCRLVFTSKNRLVFTQVHTNLALVGVLAFTVYDNKSGVLPPYMCRKVDADYSQNKISLPRADVGHHDREDA